MPYTPENNPFIPGDPYSYDLKWIVDHIKQALALYQPLHDEFEDLQSDFEFLRNYVDNYFDTLDVSAEVTEAVNNILTDWYSSGYLLALLQPSLNGMNAQIAQQNETIDTLESRVDQIVATNTTNLTGWNVVENWQKVAASSNVITYTWTDIPDDAVVLETSYQRALVGDTDPSGALQWYEDMQVWRSYDNNTIQLQKDSFTASAYAFIKLVYAVPQAVVISELEDIRVGAYGTNYNTAGNAVRGQILAAAPLRSSVAVFNVPKSPRFAINSLGNWTTGVTQRSGTISLSGIKKVRITGHATQSSVIAFLKTYNPVSGTAVDFATGYSSRITLTPGEVVEYTVSGDMNYLFALLKSSNSTVFEPTIEILTTDSSFTVFPADTEDSAEVGKTDMADQINTQLSAYGYCHLEKGIYYISKPIIMPAGTSIIGSGTDTIIKLLESATGQTMIVMESECAVKDVTIKGSLSSQKAADSGSTYGIEWTGSDVLPGIISGCKIINCDGAGIYIHDTSTQTYRNLSISDCYVSGNRIGIYISKNSEFHKIYGCTITGNGIGYYNRGGNNDISTCGIDANILGILIDDDEGANGGHGTITGCSMNHSNSNTGYGLVISGTGRMVVSNCNIYYSKILLDNTNGNIINGCGFGQQADWEITGGECSIFSNCMVRGWGAGDSPVSISGNSSVKIVNCYDRNGNAYTP